MNDLFRAISRRIAVRKNGDFQFNYSMEQGKIYTTSLIDNEKVVLNDTLRDDLGFR